MKNPDEYEYEYECHPIVEAATRERWRYMKSIIVHRPMFVELEEWPMTIEPVRWDNEINDLVSHETQLSNKHYPNCSGYRCNEPNFKSGRCEKHYKNFQRRMKELYHVRRAKGLCVKCEKDTLYGLSLCEPCCKKQSYYDKKRRDKRTAKRKQK